MAFASTGRIRPSVLFMGGFDRSKSFLHADPAKSTWAISSRTVSGPTIAERTVREYVHTRKIALGLLVREVCIPQSYAWGAEAQIDWYEAYGDLVEERTKRRCSRCGAWQAGHRFTGRSCMRHSRLS